jgi:pyruvate,orthophosphate dikinase
VQPELSGDFATLMDWADEIRRMKVRTNAETPEEAETARGFGAEGIGLCRTERMFNDDDRIQAVRTFVLDNNDSERHLALGVLQEMQKADFLKLFEIMPGMPVTIRLFDPPLHEFLPRTAPEMADLAAAMDIDVERIRQKVEELHEINPMLGNRGVRLAICFPEIIEMQAKAIFEAVLEAEDKTGEAVVPEIMVPLVAYERELKFIKDRIDIIAEQVTGSGASRFEYLVGTMIELPRAAIRADKHRRELRILLLRHQRPDPVDFRHLARRCGVYLNEYIRKGVIDRDPFVTIDVDGVGEFIHMACERGQRTRPDITLGICGEHGGDPASIAFLRDAGLHYVSCSPYRVPVARLAAAQATLGDAQQLGRYWPALVCPSCVNTSMKAFAKLVISAAHVFLLDDIDIGSASFRTANRSFAFGCREDRDPLTGDLVEDRQLEQEVELARRRCFLQTVLETEFL